jgi:hypothetical protein
VSAPARHLHVVDAETGEVLTEGCPGCVVRDDTIAGLNRKLNGTLAELGALKRDKEQEAREDGLWPKATRLFQVYCRMTPKKNGAPRDLYWGFERFEMVKPFLKKHGEEMCLRAIVGRVFDHYKSQRANGSTIHYHEWERIFGSKGDGATAASNFEESCNRAPADWKDRLPEGVT